jgi:beta-fructofuranosidase
MADKSKQKKRWLKPLAITLASLLVLWLILEIGLRIYVEAPLKTDFYSSINRESVQARQKTVGVKVVVGRGWLHLGWVADPEQESYRIEQRDEDAWKTVEQTSFGSCLLHQGGGQFRVWAVPVDGTAARLLGEIEEPMRKIMLPRAYKPVIDGAWQTLFRPRINGYYINDHTVYRDAAGDWRLVGITDKSTGNYDNEKYFAVGVSKDFPPAGGMTEADPVADFKELAWAPDVISENGTWYMFWSPHRLESMTSPDGINWGNKKTVITAPYHKFFRDGMVVKVAEGQWLLYTTAREGFFSQIDVYQSFNLKEWQYTGTALRSGWGSERNSPFASTESPFVMEYKGRYYMSLTYNNDTFFWNGILLPFNIWLDQPSYNDTLVFGSDNPYDFGIYSGAGHAPTLVTRLAAHAAEYVYVPEQDRWYITTCGWPWISTLTSGEAAVAPLRWDLLELTN